MEGVDSIYLRIGYCEHGNENLGSKNCGKFRISWESIASKERLFSMAVVTFFVSKHIFMDVHTKKDIPVLEDLKTVLRSDNI